MIDLNHLQVMEVFQPEAIVICGGADSLSGDRLGCFNLSLEGHADCMEFLAKFGVPMLILGGGIHTLSNLGVLGGQGLCRASHSLGGLCTFSQVGVQSVEAHQLIN